MRLPEIDQGSIKVQPLLKSPFSDRNEGQIERHNDRDPSEISMFLSDVWSVRVIHSTPFNPGRKTISPTLVALERSNEADLGSSGNRSELLVRK